MLLLSFSHFVVDFMCAFLVANLTQSNLALALVFYNFCAFALQMPLGIIVENNFPPLKVASVGLSIVLFSWLFLDYAMLALILAGIGNALFHLGGGLSVMNKSSLASPLGVFIAPGALGIYLGSIFVTPHKIFLFVILFVLIALLWIKKEATYTTNISPKEFSGRILAMAALFTVVVLRGFLGVLPAFTWKSEWSLPFVLAVVLGKMIGGYLSDRFGAKKVGIISLLISFVCFFSMDNPILGLIGILAFQTTMPITLWAISRITAKGFGFGLLTFGLFVGSIPIFLGLSLPIPLPVLVAVSLIVFVFGMKKEISQ